ncbi:MAG: MAG0480 family ComEC-like protein [Metamycoplasmataceae bacterium]
MTRNWRFIRYWRKNTSIFKRTYWSFLNILLFAMIAIFSFLYYETREIRWIVFIVIFSIAILFISWKWFIAVLTIVPIMFIIFFVSNNVKPITELNGNYKIVQIVSSEYVISKNSQKILLKTKGIFNIDDLINVSSINIDSLSQKKDQYSYYLKSIGIKYIANKSIATKVNDKISIRARIIDYLQKGPKFYVNYISLILLGMKTDNNKELYEKIKFISILHLFTISGFHINLLMIIILWIFKKFRMKVRYSSLIGIIIIFFYLYLLNFPISSVRAILFLCGCFINKEFFDNKFCRIKILSIIMLFMFIVNPFIVFSLSFIFTFLITFGILFVIDTKNIKIRSLLIILVSYFSSVVISILINGWVNIFGIVNSIIFSPIIIINYIISVFGFPFKGLLNGYYIFLDNIINIFYNNSLIINVDINNYFVDIYYLSLFLIISIIKHNNTIRDLNTITISGVNGSRRHQGRG